MRWHALLSVQPQGADRPLCIGKDLTPFTATKTESARGRSDRNKGGVKHERAVSRRIDKALESCKLAGIAPFKLIWGNLRTGGVKALRAAIVADQNRERMLGAAKPQCRTGAAGKRALDNGGHSRRAGIDDRVQFDHVNGAGTCAGQSECRAG